MASAKTMRAARMYGNRDIRVDDVPVPVLPELSDDWAGGARAIVQVEWCGICGSDLHEYEAGKSSSI